jgi:hypothetical protein
MIIFGGKTMLSKPKERIHEYATLQIYAIFIGVGNNRKYFINFLIFFVFFFFLNLFVYLKVLTFGKTAIFPHFQLAI